MVELFVAKHWQLIMREYEMFKKALRLQKVDVDDWWTGYAIAIPGIAGSVISFLYFGAVL